ncbi:retrovirus-related pol polyprotein from transposon TNT 1-94 [Tanacetum coccineum]
MVVVGGRRQGEERRGKILCSLDRIEPRTFLVWNPMKLGESDEDIDEEEEAKAFNLLARNFRKFLRKGNQFGCGNQFGNGVNRFGSSHGNSFSNKGGESSKQKGACYNFEIEGHFASECRMPKENKAFVGGA